MQEYEESPGSPCKRFIKNLERINKIMIDNNRTSEVILNSDATPNEIIKNSNKPKSTKKFVYESYLNQRYKTIINSKAIISEYKQQRNDSKTNTTTKCSILPKLLKVNKKPETCSIHETTGCRSPEELLDNLQKQMLEERVKKIREKIKLPSNLIGELKRRHKSFYEKIRIMKPLNKRHIDYGTIFKKSIFNSVKYNDQEIQDNTYLTEVRESIENKTIETKVTKSKRKHKSEESKINNGFNVHIGTEHFPEFLARKFNSINAITKEQVNCIREIIYNKWQVMPKLKIKKDYSSYSIIPYGENCILSNCCNSLVILNFTKDAGCKVSCLNKLCLSKTLYWFLINMEFVEVLFNENIMKTIDNISELNKIHRSKIRTNSHNNSAFSIKFTTKNIVTEVHNSPAMEHLF